MEPLKPTRPRSKTSNDTSAAPPSSAHVSPGLSPELLQTIERLQEEITELRSTKGMTAEEKAELAQLKADLKEARAELAAIESRRRTSQAPAEPQRVNYGFFTVEHAG